MSEIVLATPEERVRLLKAGFTGEEIERAYVALNGFKIRNGILCSKK